MRDEFTIKTKQVLAQRVGMRCSNPDCLKPTSGPRVEPSKAINIGVAAHITAASPGGPRFHPNLSPEERRSAENGIWLCQVCAKLVDSDTQRYTASVLRQWKKRTEDAAMQAIEANAGPVEVQDLLQKLKQLIAPQNTTKLSSVTYQISAGTETHSNPHPDRVYTKHTPDGLTHNYMVRDNKLMCESIYPDGRTLIVDITVGTIEVHKLPYRPEEMTIKVDPNDVLREEMRVLPNGNRLIILHGKWGMKIQRVVNRSNEMITYKFEYADVSIPAPFRTFVVKPKTR